MNGIKPGDVVKLKSGGPAMTVTSVGNDEMTGQMTAWVSWFDGNKPQSGAFPVHSLTVVNE